MAQKMLFDVRILDKQGAYVAHRYELVGSQAVDEFIASVVQGRTRAFRIRIFNRSTQRTRYMGVSWTA